MTLIIDGKAIAKEIKEELKVKTEKLYEEKKIRPGLALMRVGEDPASQVYVNMKAKACKAIGFHSIIEKMPEDTAENVVLEKIAEWNASQNIHGILVQMPLPKQINSEKVIDAISPEKDVDGFHPINVGRLITGLPGFIPCTPAGILELLKRYNIEAKGKHTVVLGRSNIVGKPIANLMFQKRPETNSIVTICHTATKDFSQYTIQADILIAAAGVPEMIKAKDVKNGAVIIDVGTNRVDDDSKEKGYRLTGDVDFESVKHKVSAISPSPGGVGPMTIAMLLDNTYKSATNEYFG
jgi:methylenetetrahydrofolate dehydrogenase (NADP+)/methenyltetrahydrofolate cyclohydrolase